MKHYDIIAIGTGSAMNIVSTLVETNEDIKVAVVEKDDVGGICLTRGCIPSKMLLYPAELVSKAKEAKKFGIDVEIKNIDFKRIMERMRSNIRKEVEMIEHGLKSSPNIDLYQTTGEFIDDYTMKVGDEIIKGDKILLCSGSRPLIPKIEGLEEAGYITSDELLLLEELPESIAIIGGGYIAMEYGFFLAMMGAKVTVIEMLPRIVYGEEPEISELLQKEMSKIMDIKTGYKVKRVEKGQKKKVIAEGKDGRIEIEADEILVAAGRQSNADLLKPEKTGVEVDEHGWIIVNEYLETTKPNIWACGDAIGKHMFKHVANYESQIVYYNAFGHRRIKVDYHAVPHAIFTYPEVASVGMKEEEAKKKHDIMVGYYLYEHTAKGEAMEAKDYFVKVILEKGSYRILGAHIIGPEASILIQEIVNLMYTDDASAMPIYRGMHIHPALSEVVERAFYNLEER
ncbi:MAG: dihydrolipoyl dehydrogenase [Thermoplasmata archaeon]|nr:MAG: dihydrolipoyl dehydrogenase [Thermoplasmata archaeon]